MKTYESFRSELVEASYPGNLGIMELIKFKKVASVKQKQDLTDHIKNSRHKEARDLIQKVTGTKLHPSFMSS
jgi:hypothetical protein